MEISTKRIILEAVLIGTASATIGGLTYGFLRHQKLSVSSKEEKVTAFRPSW